MEAECRTTSIESDNSKMFCVYIIRGQKDYHYCGQTHDLVSRISAHNQGKSISTRKFKPYVLKWVTETDTRTKARFIEKFIKNQGVKNYLLKCKYTGGQSRQKRLLEKYILDLQHARLS